jgi:tetratricopeptide (TPR) repeat protein
MFLHLLAASCSSRKTDPAFEPHENLLSVVAEVQRFANLDLYRFRAPLDPSGINLFRASLVRLANYEQLFPGRSTDAIAYVRGQIHERLGDHAAAAESFGQALKMGTAVAPEAAESAAINRRFARLIEIPRKAETLGEYLKALDEQQAGFLELADEYSTGSWRAVYGALARRQVERADVQRAEALWKHRNLLDDGTARALKAWKETIERHAGSARVEQWRLRMGDCLYEQAREYAQEHDPEGAEFRWEVFERMTSAALSHYRQVERAYGYEERLEAAGKIEAVNAFVGRVRVRSR